MGVSPCDPMTWRKMFAEHGWVPDLAEGNMST